MATKKKKLTPREQFEADVKKLHKIKSIVDPLVKEEKKLKERILKYKKRKDTDEEIQGLCLKIWSVERSSFDAEKFAAEQPVLVKRLERIKEVQDQYKVTNVGQSVKVTSVGKVDVSEVLSKIFETEEEAAEV